MSLKPYKTVAMFVTIDGVAHSNENDAIEHAEDKAARELGELLAKVEGMGAQMQYRLTCHFLKNAKKYSDALKILNCFEDEDGDNK